MPNMIVVAIPSHAPTTGRTPQLWGRTSPTRRTIAASFLSIVAPLANPTHEIANRPQQQEQEDAGAERDGGRGSEQLNQGHRADEPRRPSRQPVAGRV